MDIVFYVDYKVGKVGTAPSSAPTFTLLRVLRSTGVESSSVAAGASMTASSLAGRYYYRLTGADLNLYDYHGRATTSDTTVDDREPPVLWTRWSEAVALDSSGRVTVGGYASGQVPLQPTTAGRTLDVSATGGAGIDWSNVEAPTTTVNLSGTTVGAIATGGITAASFATGALDATAELSTDAIDAIKAAVWANTTRTLTAGTNIVLAKGTGLTGLNDLDAAGIRGAVGLASANLDTQLTAIDDFLDTEIAAIKAKTDNLPSDPADASDIAASFSTVNGTLATLAGYVDTEVAAIKAKTDNLPTSFPTNFAALLINASGHVSRVTLADTTTTLTNLPAVTTDWLTAAGVSAAAVTKIQAGLTGLDAAGVRTAIGLASANLDTQIAGIPVAVRDVTNTTPATGSLGAAVNASASGGLDPQDVADLVVANIGTVDANVVSIAANAITAASLATDAGTEIAAAVVAHATITGIKAKTDNLPTDPADASDIAAAFGTVNTALGLLSGYVDTEVGAIKTVTDHLATALVLDGSVYQWTANALELAPTGGGGGGEVTLSAGERTAIAAAVFATPVESGETFLQHCRLMRAEGIGKTVVEVDEDDPGLDEDDNPTNFILTAYRKDGETIAFTAKFTTNGGQRTAITIGSV